MEISDNIEPAGNLSIEDLNRVRLTVTADLGKCTMLVRDVLELQRGSVVQLDKLAGEMTQLQLKKGAGFNVIDYMPYQFETFDLLEKKGGKP